MIWNGFKIIFISAAIIGLLSFLYFTGFSDPIKKGVYSFFGPAMSRLYSASSDIRSGFADRGEIKDMSLKMKELENKTAKLLSENAKLKEIKEENERLRSYLDFLEKNDLSYKMAHVVSKGSSAALKREAESITIDRGKGDGLYPGLAVINSQGVVIGKIKEVEEGFSRVELSNSGGCKLAATIQNEDRTIGVVGGELGLTMNMDFIAQDEEINKGDTVVTSGLEENIPRGLLIGEVSRVDSSSNEIWKSVVVESPADFNDVLIVSAVIP